MSLFRKLVHRFIYGNDYELIYNPNRKAQDRLTVEAIAGAAGLNMIQGAIQQSFLIRMGASDLAVSYMATLTLVAGVSCVFGGAVFDGRRKRKRIIVAMLLSARLLLSAMMFLPWLLQSLFGQAVKEAVCVPLMIGIILLCTVITSVADVGYNSLLAAVIPSNIRGRMMAVRSTISNLVIPIVPVAAAYFLDQNGQADWAYMTLGGLCALLVTLEAVLLMSVQEAEYKVYEKENRMNPRELFSVLKAQPRYLRFVTESFLFYLFLYICGTFTTLYMINYVGLSLTLIEIGGFVCKLCMVLQFRLWGKLSDHLGAGRIVFIAQCLFGVEMLSWMLLPPKWLAVGFVLVPFVLQAASNSSFTISLFARKLNLAPEENQNLFIGFYGAAIALACLVGPTIGNLLKLWLEQHLSAGLLAGHYQIRLIYLVSAVLIFAQKGIQLLKNHQAEV